MSERDPAPPGPAGSPLGGTSPPRPLLAETPREPGPWVGPASGHGDPRVRHTGPGPGAGGEQEPARSSKLSVRLALALTVVMGQLWGLTVAANEWMRGDTRTAQWLAGFLVLSFVVVLVLWLIDPEDR
ncbi:hypothetical protein ABT112_05785 [Streptomyces sp. NPDC002055]|uniref:hypothetical protein n=1 Tax=Streptomyces sp. NPDC002055 TaxID=3154534 RepID=UPI00331EDFA3